MTATNGVPRPAGALLDDESSPPLRVVIGALMARARTADIAISRVRLANIDLSPSETGSVRRCRVLFGALDVDALDAGSPVARPGVLDRLRALLDSGRLEVRSCRTRTWTPDFSIFAGLPCRPAVPHGAVCLAGAHFFYAQPASGPSFTAVLSDARSIARAADRFERLWAESYDVAGVVREAIDTCFRTVGP